MFIICPGLPSPALPEATQILGTRPHQDPARCQTIAETYSRVARSCTGWMVSMLLAWATRSRGPSMAWWLPSPSRRRQAFSKVARVRKNSQSPDWKCSLPLMVSWVSTGKLGTLPVEPVHSGAALPW